MVSNIADKVNDFNKGVIILRLVFSGCETVCFSEAMLSIYQDSDTSYNPSIYSVTGRDPL